MKSNTVATLEGLIAICKDGEEGFRVAAEGVENSDLKALFQEYSMQRQGFANELQNELVALGDPNPPDQPSALGAAHRAWIKIREAISSRDDRTVLTECERGEDAAVEAYQQALKLDEIPEALKNKLAEQYSIVQTAHDRVRELRDQRSTE